MSTCTHRLICVARMLVGLTAAGMCEYPRPGGEFSLETCRVLTAMLDDTQQGSAQLGVATD